MMKSSQDLNISDICRFTLIQQKIEILLDSPVISQLAFTRSMLTIETLEQGVKYVQS